MAQDKKFDLAVIGSGPGGYVSAIRASQLGMQTALVERDKLGGVCLNWGCIPSKALLTNAKVYNHIRHADNWGISTGEVSFDIERIIGRSRDVADSISKGVAFLMKKNKIEVVSGTARFATLGDLEIKDESGKKTSRLSADHIIVATGARPRSIPGIEIDGKNIITSRHALEMARIPESVVIIGAGAIGCEFGYFYNSFGSEVTLVEMMDQLLPLEDHEIGKELARSFKKQGIRFNLKTKVLGARSSESETVVEIENEKGEQSELKADIVLCAIGVTGNVEGLGLEDIGVTTEKNQIEVDEWYRTGTKGVYAIGDVIGPPFLAHVASHEGIVCVEKIAGAGPHPVDYQNIPACTYCQPQVASVGLSEKQARADGYKVRIGKFPFRALGKARASQSIDGFVKLVFDEKYGELLGAHIIGEEATEMIAELGVAKALETTHVELLKTVHAHPTLSEAVMEAAGEAYGEQIHI
jgi:dihydrolipoamide dehydrogenase